MRRLERYGGHFYNWYDTRTLRPLQPLYVSSVDSGNLAGHLLTLGAGLREEAQARMFGPEICSGLRDTVDVLRELHPSNTGLIRLELLLTPAPPPGLRGMLALLEQVQKEAERIAAEFSAEQKRVTDGERKLAGKWLTKEEVQRESYQINGAIAFNYLREQAARNDVTGALNTFATIEEQYPRSRGYLDAVEFVRPLLPRLKSQADARLAAIPGELAEQKKGLDLSSAAKRVEYQADLDRERFERAERALRLGARVQPALQGLHGYHCRHG